MHRIRIPAAAAAAAAALALSSVAGAQVVPMYSFEGDLQGFAANGGGTTVAADTIGATDGTGSLRFSQVAGATFTGALTSTVVSPVFPIDPGLQSVLLDVTVPAGAEFTGAFANIGLTLFGASQPDYPGGQQFGLQWQANQFANVDLAPGTHTVTLGPLTGTNPLTFDTNQTFAQAFGTGANQLIPTGFQLYINKSNDAPLTVYIDNIRAVVPEPASLSLVALGALPLLRRRRQA